MIFKKFNKNKEAGYVWNNLCIGGLMQYITFLHASWDLCLNAEMKVILEVSLCCAQEEMMVCNTGCVLMRVDSQKVQWWHQGKCSFSDFRESAINNTPANNSSIHHVWTLGYILSLFLNHLYLCMQFCSFLCSVRDVYRLLQRADVSRDSPRDEGGSDADDGLRGAGASWRTFKHALSSWAAHTAGEE